MLRTIKNIFSLVYNRYYFRKKFNANVRSPYVSKNINLGTECQVAKNVTIGPGVRVGKCTYFNSSELGYIVVESGTEIGAFCSIAPNVFIGPGNHPIELLTTHPILFDDFWKRKFKVSNRNLPKIQQPGENVKTIIGNDVWIGTGAIITAGVKIGNGAVIAAGSIVTKDIPPYSIVGGTPAKVIKKRFSEEAINQLESCEEKWWEWSTAKIRDNIQLFYDVDMFINQNCNNTNIETSTIDRNRQKEVKIK